MKAALLRQSILQAALQGKLVPQNIHDEPATELLKQIQQEKARLVKEGRTKKEKPFSPIAKDQILYDLPDRWVWCRLGDVTQFVATGPFGSMLHKSDYVNNGIPLVNPANMKNGIAVASDRMMVDEATRDRLSSYILHKDDIVVARRGDLGRCAIITENEDGWLCGTGSFFLHLSSFIYQQYFVLLISSPVSRGQLMGESVGTTMNNLNHGILKNLNLPLPPLSEQQRIVAKVDELMALCDELEAAENELDELESRFAEYLPKSILQAAVQGKLVPQNVHDEPASELLKQIQQEKARLVKEGRTKKEKPLPSIEEDEISYDLPDGWVWCRHNELFDISGGSQPPKSVFSEIKKENYIRLYQIRDYGQKPSPVFIPKTQASKTTRKGDILLARYGASLGKVFWAEDGAYNVAMAKVIPLFVSNLVDRSFVFNYYLSPLYQDMILGNTRSAQAGFNKDDLNTLLFPLPPLAEQQRIVAKVDELMVLCNELKAAKAISVMPTYSNVVPFSKQGEEIELAMVARGDGSQKHSKKLQQVISDLLEGDEDE